LAKAAVSGAGIVCDGLDSLNKMNKSNLETAVAINDASNKVKSDAKKEKKKNFK